MFPLVPLSLCIPWQWFCLQDGKQSKHIPITAFSLYRWLESSPILSMTTFFHSSLFLLLVCFFHSKTVELYVTRGNVCPSNPWSFYQNPVSLLMSLVTWINEAWKTNMGLLDIFDSSKAFSGQIFYNIYFILQMVLSFIFIIIC